MLPSPSSPHAAARARPLPTGHTGWPAQIGVWTHLKTLLVPVLHRQHRRGHRLLPLQRHALHAQHAHAISEPHARCPASALHRAARENVHTCSSAAARQHALRQHICMCTCACLSTLVGAGACTHQHRSPKWLCLLLHTGGKTCTSHGNCIWHASRDCQLPST